MVLYEFKSRFCDVLSCFLFKCYLISLCGCWGSFGFFLTQQPHKKNAMIGTWYQSLRFSTAYDSICLLRFPDSYVISLSGCWGSLPDLQGMVAVFEFCFRISKAWWRSSAQRFYICYLWLYGEISKG